MFITIFFVILGRTTALSSPGPPSTTLPVETRCWRTSMSGRRNSRSAAGGEAVDQREGGRTESLFMRREEKRE